MSACFRTSRIPALVTGAASMMNRAAIPCSPPQTSWLGRRCSKRMIGMCKSSKPKERACAFGSTAIKPLTTPRRLAASRAPASSARRFTPAAGSKRRSDASVSKGYHERGWTFVYQLNVDSYENYPARHTAPDGRYPSPEASAARKCSYAGMVRQAMPLRIFPIPYSAPTEVRWLGRTRSGRLVFCHPRTRTPKIRSGLSRHFCFQ